MMHLRIRRFFFAMAAALAFVPQGLAVAQGAAKPYKNPSLPVEQRVDDLVGRMTLDEKIGQTLQVARDYLKRDSDIAAYYLGSVLSGGGSAPATNNPRSWADMIDGYQRQALSTRLGIPLIYGIDAVHGNNNVKGATIFPHNIGMGAANDPELVAEAARITALEMLATGARWDFAPCVAVPADERWGRTYEGYGSDPKLAGELGAAAIRSLQDGGLGSGRAVLATAKHFAGDGGTTGGVDRGDTVASEAEFRSRYIAPYVDAIAAGAQCVMVSFNSWNGVPDHGNKHLLTDILRGELGFTGFVVSDWGGVELVPGSPDERIAQCFNAGVDMMMIPDDYPRYFDTMKTLVADGRISAARLDEALRRILAAKFSLGLFERPFADRSLLSQVGSAEHRAVARRAVAESLVVLKNEGGLLPIGERVKNILVLGSRAQDIGAQCGGWTISWQGSRGDITPGTSIYQGIVAAAGPSRKVAFSPSSSVPAGFKPDLVIAVVGEDPYAEMKGDSSDLRLVGRDRALVIGAAKLGAPVLTVLLSGRPLIVSDDIDRSQAYIAAWLPGTEGAGVADVLFGAVAARGKLPRAWPASVEQLPLGPTSAALFPAGYGLTP